MRCDRDVQLGKDTPGKNLPIQGREFAVSITPLHDVADTFTSAGASQKLARSQLTARVASDGTTEHKLGMQFCIVCYEERHGRRKFALHRTNSVGFSHGRGPDPKGISGFNLCWNHDRWGGLRFPLSPAARAADSRRQRTSRRLAPIPRETYQSLTNAHAGGA